MRILVTGGTGFLGRQVSRALRERRHTVIVGSRRAYDARRMHFEYLLAPEAWLALLKDVAAVVNCVGILREVGRATYERVHHEAPAALAAACSRSGIRLVHVSALGLGSAARSGFIASKRRGEAAVRASGADYTIVRPSLLDGEGGFGARWMRRVAQWPVHFVPRDAVGRIAVLHVDDAARAIARLVERGGIREAELGGAEWRTLEAHLAALRHAGRPAAVVRVPAMAARVASHGCDALHVTPFSFGHLELLRRDNVPSPNLLPQLLQEWCGAETRAKGSEMTQSPSTVYATMSTSMGSCASMA